jgi:hypothetical protein
MSDIEPISLDQFEALAGPTVFLYRLIESYRIDDVNGAVIGAVLLDRTDKDWSWVTLTQLKGLDARFRAVDLQTSCSTIDLARTQLHIAMTRHARTS